MGTFDTSQESSPKGHEENVTAESVENELGNLGQVENEESQEIQDDTGETQKEKQERLLAGKYKSAEELEKAYQSLQSKLGENSTYVERAKQMENYFKQNPEAAKVLQEYSQNENFRYLTKAYNEGLIKQDNLQRLRQYYAQAQRQQQQTNQVDPQLMNKINAMEQQVQNQNQQIQNMALVDMQSRVENDYSQLKEQYGEVINDMDVEDLTQIAIDHNFTKQGQYTPVPDLEQALRYHIASNPQSLQMLAKMGQNEVNKANVAKQQAQVESSSNRQQQQSQSPEDQMINDIINANTSSGSGF